MNGRWAYLFLAIGLGFFIYWVQLTVSHPVSYDITEGVVLQRSIALVEGGVVYPTLEAPPYYVTPYTPLVIALMGAFVELFGAHIWIGRALSILAFFGTIFAAASIIKARCGGYKRALIMMSLLLCSYHVLTNATTFGLSWVGIFFSVAGLALLRRNLLFAFLVMSLGVMTKQSQILAPAAALLWLLFRDWKKAFACGILFVMMVVGELAICRLIFGPQFLEHVLKYTVGTYSITNLLRLFAYCLAPYSIFIGIAAVVLYRRIRARDLDPVFFYFILNFIWLFATMRVGSDSKYFLEFYVALFMLIVPFVLSDSIDSLIPRRAFVFQMVLLCIFSGYMYWWNTGRVVAKDNGVKAVVAELKDIRGEMIFEDASMAVAAGKPLYIEAFPMSEMARQGLWNQMPFLKSLEKGEFSRIILQFDVFNDAAAFFTARERFTDEMRAEIRKSYTLDKQVGPFYLYRPNS